MLALMPASTNRVLSVIDRLAAISAGRPVAVYERLRGVSTDRGQDGRDDVTVDRLRVWGVVGLVLAIGAVVLVEARNATEFWPVAVPGVLTGVGTLALAAVTYSVLRGDQADRRAREERDRREQASLVHVGAPELFPWAEVVGQRDGQGIQQQYAGWRVKIVNGSQYPVSVLTLHSRVAPDGLVSSAQTGLLTQRRNRLLPGESWTTEFNLQVRLEPPPTVTANLAFVDAAGYRWKRDSAYRLTDITDLHDMMM
jgi:hypothetical protein